MGLVDIIKENEKVYMDEDDIKYLFCKRKGSDKLIVVFPAITKPGRFVYNYVNTLQNVNAHRLFLLDNFGYRECYLIGENRNFSVENTVISLINTILQEHNIKKDDVILIGSSKGGWNALYYGIKYRFGYVITGGCHTRLGEFLIKHEFAISLKTVADHISGGHEEEDCEYLNNLLYDLLYDSPDDFPNLFIHIGTGDSMYPTHILPFIKELDDLNISYHLDVQEYDEHNTLALYFPEYLFESLKSIESSLVNDIYSYGEKTNLGRYTKSEAIKLFIDFIMDVYNSTVSIKGWAFIENKDIEDYKKYLIIKNEGRLTNYKYYTVKKYEVVSESRPDVAKVFDNPQYKHSGFICRINKDSLENKF